MTRPEEIDRELQALRERVSALSAAILRISASLDLATVLQEVIDSARALTGARYGVIATVDDAGEVQDFVSSGFSPEEHDQLAEWADGPRLFEHLRNLPGPLQVGNLHHYVRSLGFFPGPDDLEHLAGRADAPPRCAGRQLLPCWEGGRHEVY